MWQGVGLLTITAIRSEALQPDGRSLMLLVPISAVCPAGSGTVSLGENCAPCSPGFFGDPNRAAGVLACTPCPGSAASTFTFQYNGDHSITVNPITEMGATSAQQCLLEYASIVIESNW